MIRSDKRSETLDTDGTVQCVKDGCIREFATDRARNIHHTQVHTNGPTRQEFLTALQQLSTKLGRTPRKTDMDDQGPYSSPTYQDRFGSWNLALKKAGLEPNHTPGTAQEVACDWCDDVIVREPWKLEENEHHFCTKDCYGSWKSEHPSEVMLRSQAGESSPVWNGGYESPAYGPAWREKRKRVLERDNHACQSCTMTDEEHHEEYGRSLDIHHIKPIKAFDELEEAHRIENLVTLCTPCHSIHEGILYRPVTACVLPKDEW